MKANPHLELLHYLDNDMDVSTAEMLNDAVDVYWLLRTLHGCQEPFPSLYGEMLGLPPGSTYAEAVCCLQRRLGE